MTPFPVDLSLEGANGAVVGRAEQLCALEAELAEKNTHVYDLQRKVKNLKEKLSGKVFRTYNCTYLMKLLPLIYLINFSNYSYILIFLVTS